MSPSPMTERQNGHVGPVVRPDDSSASIHPTRHALQLRCEHADRVTAAVGEAFKSSTWHSGQIEMDVVAGVGVVLVGAGEEAFAWLGGLRDGTTSPSACATLQAFDDMAML